MLNNFKIDREFGEYSKGKNYLKHLNNGLSYVEFMIHYEDEYDQLINFLDKEGFDLELILELYIIKYESIICQNFINFLKFIAIRKEIRYKTMIINYLKQIDSDKYKLEIKCLESMIK